MDGAKALDRRELRVRDNLSLRLIPFLSRKPFQSKVIPMKKLIFALSIIFALGLTALAQESGNSVYGSAQKRRSQNVSLGNLYATEAKDAVSSPFIEAYVL